MDITGVIQTQQPSSDVFNAGKLAPVPAVKKSETVKEPVQVPAVDQSLLAKADEKRLADIKKVIERNSFKDTFAVRDNRFTIFKDVSGQFITRFTSLRDGSVTYVPEPEILRFSGGSDSYIQVNV